MTDLSNELRRLEYRLERLSIGAARLADSIRAAEEDDQDDDSTGRDGDDRQSILVVACTACGLPLPGATISVVDNSGVTQDTQVSGADGNAHLNYRVNGVIYTIYGHARDRVIASNPSWYGPNVTSTSVDFAATGGYYQAPTISFVPAAMDPGKGAAAYAALQGGTPSQLAKNYFVSSITVTNKGANYGTPPAVAIGDNGQGDTGCVATAYTGRVGSATVPGSGTGSGYVNGAGISFPAAGAAIAASGTISTGAGGAITGVTLTTGGAGYSSAPSASISGGGGGAVVTPHMIYGQVEAVVVSRGGDPAVCVTGYGVTRVLTLATQWGTEDASLCPPDYRTFPPQRASGNVYSSGTGNYWVAFHCEGAQVSMYAQGMRSGLPLKDGAGVNYYTPCAFVPEAVNGALPVAVAPLVVDSWAPFSGHADFTGTAADGVWFQGGSKVVTITGT